MNMEEMDDNKGMKKYVNKLSDRKLQRTDQKENEKISFDKYQQRVHKRQDSN